MQRNNGLGSVVQNVTKSRRLRMLIAGLVMLTILLGMAVVPAEIRYGRGGNILDMGDGLWWAITTVTGVGYGDLYPVTTLGRAIGVVLQTSGVVLFGSIIAVVSISILRYQEDFYIRRIMERLDRTDNKIDELKKHMDFLIKDRVEK